MLSMVFTAIFCAQAAWTYSSPPSGAITQCTLSHISTSRPCTYKTSRFISSTLAAGTYTGHTLISRSNIKIYGQISTADSYTGNTVTLTNSLSADDARSHDASGAVRVHGSNIALYNLNIVNSLGEDQATALSVQFSGYGLKIVGYQLVSGPLAATASSNFRRDTLLANVGYEFIATSYMEGNTDFIFGQTASLWITGSVIHTLGYG
ncbi:hypothetical protein EV421DRAFT_1907086 [Armillaria borealis]|uniref:Uncharacterized protein n=1 Tax=Armillaria borealis TaxID=47425 RepID=A0AA39J9V9_9AGAR|nr:hypothetical protein EV421DRAFT_1907086 [Armillaria borealis]